MPHEEAVTHTLSRRRMRLSVFPSLTVKRTEHCTNLNRILVIEKSEAGKSSAQLDDGAIFIVM